MQLEMGQILIGQVVKITKFGVFVKLKSGMTGLVHISEISKNFVDKISNFLEIGDEVSVKVLHVEENKLNLSIKQVQDLPKKLNYKKNKQVFNDQKITSNANPATFKKPNENNSKLSFEEMLSKFKKNSEENLSYVKRNFDSKRNSYSKKR